MDNFSQDFHLPKRNFKKSLPAAFESQRRFQLLGIQVLHLVENGHWLLLKLKPHMEHSQKELIVFWSCLTSISLYIFLSVFIRNQLDVVLDWKASVKSLIAPRGIILLTCDSNGSKQSPSAMGSYINILVCSLVIFSAYLTILLVIYAQVCNKAAWV